jgi:hypothetical protein
VFLYCEQDKIGSADFELNDFLSDKVVKREFMKLFSGKTLPILTWGLKVDESYLQSQNSLISAYPRYN